MRILKTTLMVAWFSNIAILLVCVFLHIAAGRQVASDRFLAIAGASWCLISGLLWLVQLASEGGSVVVGIFFSVGPWAMGVAFLSVGGVLPDFFRLWATGVFLTWLALFVLVFCLAQHAAAREARKIEPATTPPQQADKGRLTMPQLALVLMSFGVFALMWAIKCLVFGPPPYSVFAYVSGPILLVAGYLVDPGAIRYLRNECFKPPKPPADDGE